MSNRDGFFIDLSTYKDRSSAHLVPGKYLVRVTDAELTETKKGDPMVNLFYTVVGGAHDGEPLIDRLTLTEKAAWRVVKVLRALGVKVEKRNMQIPFKLILGRTLVVTVEDGEPYNGETRSEIRDYAPGSTWEGAAPAAPAVAEVEETVDAEEFEREFPENLGEISTQTEIAVPDSGEITL
jgi:biotin operon repressor